MEDRVAHRANELRGRGARASDKGDASNSTHQISGSREEKLDDVGRESRGASASLVHLHRDLVLREAPSAFQAAIGYDGCECADMITRVLPGMDILDGLIQVDSKSHTAGLVLLARKRQRIRSGQYEKACVT